VFGELVTGWCVSLSGGCKGVGRAGSFSLCRNNMRKKCKLQGAMQQPQVISSTEMPEDAILNRNSRSNSRVDVVRWQR